MATWQFDLHLIPRAKLIELYGEVPADLDRDTLDRHEWWTGESVAYDEALNAFLNESTSWSEHFRNWGDEDGNCVCVILEDNEVAEIYARVDVRSLDRAFLENLSEFSRKRVCLFLTEDGKLIEPNVDLLLSEIAQSNALAFVSDPVGFLEKIKSHGWRPRT